jgi:hypothetical protein
MSGLETWATFSVDDHRTPIYRQSLALFDKIVVPVPAKPLDGQTLEELDQLNADVAYLEANGAAYRFNWTDSEFWSWRKPLLAEALSVGISRDPYRDSRLMLAEKIDLPGVQAVPVYASAAEYGSTRKALLETPEHIENALTFEILQRLPVPDADTPLANLISLRQNPAFRLALDDLLEWKRTTLPMIVVESDKPRALVAAMGDFDRLTRQYAEAMQAEGYRKVGTVASIFFSLATGEFLGAIKEGLVSFRELREPIWKKLSAMKCAPGGVVYQFEDAVKYS